MTILAIDPGPEESAFVLFDGEGVLRAQCWPNADVLREIEILNERDHDLPLAIEWITHMGMPAGRELFETCYWVGRFAQAHSRMPVTRISRVEVKLNLCGSARAKDPNIRQALLDRFGGKEAAIGRKASPGPLYGVSGHAWSALAVAVTWFDTAGKLKGPDA